MHNIKSILEKIAGKLDYRGIEEDALQVKYLLSLHSQKATTQNILHAVQQIQAHKTILNFERSSFNWAMIDNLYS